MSFINKFAWSGVAVLFAAVLALGLMAPTAHAALGLTNTTAIAFPTISKATNAANGTGNCTAQTTSGVFTEASVGDLTTGTTLILTAPAGWNWCNAPTVTFTPSVAGTIFTNAPSTPTAALTSTTVVTITAGATAATGVVGKVTVSGLTVRPTTDAAVTASVALTGTAATANAAYFTLTNGGSTSAAFAFTQPSGANQLILGAPGITCDATAFTNQQTQPVTIPADASAAWVLCTRLVDDVGNPAGGSLVTFTVSIGIVSTGTAKTVGSTTNSTGYVTTTYRGSGNANTTDSVVATFNVKNAVATQTITLAAASGGTASKMAFNAPPVLSVAANVTNTSPGYSSPQTGTDVALQVQDASGLGVNSQVLLLTVDKGTLVANAAFGTITGTQCPGTAKSITLTTAGTNLPSRGGTATSGYVNFTYCGLQTDAPGKATITAQNITTSMANSTQSITMAGAPSKIEVTTSGNTLSVKVSDAAGNPAADNTTVRFVTPANTGAVSTACATTTNGVATATAALVAATGSVIVSTDWNTTGGAASASNCGTVAVAAVLNNTGSAAGSGSQTVSTSATVGVNGTTTTTPPAAGAGSISSGSVPAAGGFGLIVASGDIKGVVTASGCPAASAAFWATVNGNFVTYVPGTTISAVNADFLAAFPGGILPAATPLIAKCK